MTGAVYDECMQESSLFQQVRVLWRHLNLLAISETYKKLNVCLLKQIPNFANLNQTLTSHSYSSF